MLFLYLPTPNEQTAKKIAKCLLEKHLVACANIFPISSLYWWEGKVADEGEVVLLVKTERNFAKQVEAEVKKLHPYSIPCIAQLPVKVNKEYEKWVRKQLKK